jgi:hypothetical protein
MHDDVLSVHYPGPNYRLSDDGYVGHVQLKEGGLYTAKPRKNVT